MGNIIEYTEEMVGAKHPTKADTLNRAHLTNHSTVGKHTDIQIVSTGRISSSGGTIEMTVGGTTGFVLDSSGGLRLPKQPAFLVRSTGMANISTTAWTQVVFGSETFDNNNDFAANVFTAPVTGKYALSYSIRLTDVDKDADSFVAEILTSNGEFTQQIDPGVMASDPASWHIAGSIVADMDASDTAQIRVLQNAGVAQTDIGSVTWFSGHLVG